MVSDCRNEMIANGESLVPRQCQRCGLFGACDNPRYSKPRPMTAEEQLAIAIDALNAIKNPLRHMVNRLKPGEQLSEIAPYMVKDAGYLQYLATNALHAIASNNPKGWYGE